MAKTILLSRKAPAPTREKGAPSNPTSHKSENVVVVRDGLRLYGRTKRLNGDGEMVVELAVPNSDGVLYFTGAEIAVPKDTVKTVDAVSGGRVVMFRSHQPIGESFEIDNPTTPVKTVKFVEIKDKDSGIITDYRDIMIEGYASTFMNVTTDRDKDRIQPSAYTGNLGDFLKNPVMLANHTNQTKSQLGSFQKLQITALGLFVQGQVTNSPHMIHERFLIAEGHLKAFSVGGFFFFNEDDFHLVEKIEIFEISVVPVPANQDALFTTRSLTIEEISKAMTRKIAA